MGRSSDDWYNRAARLFAIVLLIGRRIGGCSLHDWRGRIACGKAVRESLVEFILGSLQRIRFLLLFQHGPLFHGRRVFLAMAPSAVRDVVETDRFAELFLKNVAPPPRILSILGADCFQGPLNST